jgi:glutamate 5-kinase
MEKLKRIVVKIGTKVITSKEKALDKQLVKEIVGQISRIKSKGIDVVLVTSGAIGSGMGLLGLKKRPSRLSELQAAAAIGQSHLMRVYGECFKEDGYLVGQILITQEDFNDRARYLNIKHTIDKLLEQKVVPIINENDTVATDEIRCGDNDKISALVSDLSGADKLILLTDVEGLLDRDGKVISMVADVDQSIYKLAGKSHCDLGTGGMATKIECARMVADAGIECVIADGRSKDVLLKIIDGADIGTTFNSKKARLIAKKRWIAYSSKAKGRIIIDDGARDAILKGGKSLLASGIIGVEGGFSSGAAVSVITKDGQEIVRGITNYSSAEVSKIKGLKSEKFKSVLGYAGHDEIIHKDNLVVL